MSSITVTTAIGLTTDTITCVFSNTAIIPVGNVIQISVSKLVLPGSLNSQSNIGLSTGDKWGLNGLIQIFNLASYLNTLPSNDLVSTTQSKVTMVGNNGVLATNVQY